MAVKKNGKDPGPDADDIAQALHQRAAEQAGMAVQKQADQQNQSQRDQAQAPHVMGKAVIVARRLGTCRSARMPD